MPERIARTTINVPTATTPKPTIAQTAPGVPWRRARNAPLWPACPVDSDVALKDVASKLGAEGGRGGGATEDGVTSLPTGTGSGVVRFARGNGGLATGRTVGLTGGGEGGGGLALGGLALAKGGVGLAPGSDGLARGGLRDGSGVSAITLVHPVESSGGFGGGFGGGG
ncbi:MAG: hypothetical protein WD875_15620 [Pirellulales bacterium]